MHFLTHWEGLFFLQTTAKTRLDKTHFLSTYNPFKVICYTYLSGEALFNLSFCIPPAGSTVRAEGTWAFGDQHFGSSPDVSRWPAHRGSRRATQEPTTKDGYVYTLHKIICILAYIIDTWHWTQWWAPWWQTYLLFCNCHFRVIKMKLIVLLDRCHKLLNMPWTILLFKAL